MAVDMIVWSSAASSSASIRPVTVHGMFDFLVASISTGHLLLKYLTLKQLYSNLNIWQLPSSFALPSQVAYNEV